MIDKLQNILDLISLAEKLKSELRHSWLSSGRQESVAEHTWRMALMAIALAPHLDRKVDLLKTLKMVIFHDLVEIEAGDVSALDILRNPDIKGQKQQKEQLAIRNLRENFGSTIGEEIYQLWNEFEQKNSYEARFANALDKLEVQIQHNHADISTWEAIEFEMVYMMGQHVAFDKGLTLFKNLVEKKAEEKMKMAGIDVSALNQPKRPTSK